MDSTDLEVLKACDTWLTQESRCELVTVIKTWGASPRPAGAMLAICEDGRVIGSVSGGCVEDDLIERVRKAGMKRVHPELVTYGITADEAHRLGLPCGGTLQLVIEPLSDTSRIPELLQRVGRQELVSRVLHLSSGAVELAQGHPDQQVEVVDGNLATLYGPRWRLLVIGAGQLSGFLAQIAKGMDYQVLVCDPRQEYRMAWHVPAVEVVHAMPDDFIIEQKPDSRCAIVALTHDPKLDDLALMEALRSGAFYVGAIGSRINNAKRRERLKQFDLTDEHLARLHGPIGLHIGSRVPAEIAISILAEVTAVKNGISLADKIQRKTDIS